MNSSKASFQSLPKKLQVLIIVLAVFAIVVLCWSVWGYSNQIHNNGWIPLLLLSILAVPFTIILPSIEATVCLGQPYLMAIALLYGTSTCVIASVVYAFLVNLLFHRMSSYYILCFNFSVIVSEAYLYSTAYEITRPTNPNWITPMVLPVAFMALVSFMFVSLITATAVAWKRGIRISGWWAKFLPLSLNSFIEAAIALGIAVTISVNRFAPLIFAPAMGLIWGWTEIYKARLNRVASP